KKAVDVWMEIAPYQTSVAKKCGYGANSHAEPYPSLPNYIAMTSGGVPGAVAGRDCTPSGSCVATAPSIFAQTGGSWRGLAHAVPPQLHRQQHPDGPELTTE